MDAARAARLATQVGPGLPPEASLPHGCIIGALRIDGSCAIEDCANTSSAEWASGPVCNVVGAVATLPGAPVAHKGALGLWPIDAEAREKVRDGLAAARIVANDPARLPPASTQAPSKSSSTRRPRGGASAKRKRDSARTIDTYFSAMRTPASPPRKGVVDDAACDE